LFDISAHAAKLIFGFNNTDGRRGEVTN